MATGANRTDFDEETPPRVRLAIQPCGCWLDVYKFDSALLKAEISIQGAEACAEHAIPTWQDVIAQFDPAPE